MATKELPRSSTVSNFAQRHSLSISGVYRLIRTNQLKSFKVNNTTRIAEKDELSWLETAMSSEEGQDT